MDLDEYDAEREDFAAAPLRGGLEFRAYEIRLEILMRVSNAYNALGLDNPLYTADIPF